MSGQQKVNNLADPAVVRELFAMAADEVLYRVSLVARKKMAPDKARDMDDALARHLARALMGENPQFQAVPDWSGMPCARSLSAVDQAVFDSLLTAEKSADMKNPRLVMVLAMTAFVRALYQALEDAVQAADVSEETVRVAMRAQADRYALAAMPAKKN